MRISAAYTTTMWVRGEMAEDEYWATLVRAIDEHYVDVTVRYVRQPSDFASEIVEVRCREADELERSHWTFSLVRKQGLLLFGGELQRVSEPGVVETASSSAISFIRQCVDSGVFHTAYWNESIPNHVPWPLRWVRGSNRAVTYWRLVDGYLADIVWRTIGPGVQPRELNRIDADLLARARKRLAEWVDPGAAFSVSSAWPPRLWKVTRREARRRFGRNYPWIVALLQEAGIPEKNVR